MGFVNHTLSLSGTQVLSQLLVGGVLRWWQRQHGKRAHLVTCNLHPPGCAVHKCFGSSRYRSGFLWGVLSGWQRLQGDALVHLGSERRGCLSLPDADCCYLPVSSSCYASNQFIA